MEAITPRPLRALPPAVPVSQCAPQCAPVLDAFPLGCRSHYAVIYTARVRVRGTDATPNIKYVTPGPRSSEELRRRTSCRVPRRAFDAVPVVVLEDTTEVCLVYESHSQSDTRRTHNVTCSCTGVRAQWLSLLLSHSHCGSHIHNTTPLHPLLRQIRRSRAFRRSGTCVRLRPLPLRRVAGEVHEKDFTRLRGREACSPAFGQAHGRRRDLSLARVDRLRHEGQGRRAHSWSGREACTRAYTRAMRRQSWGCARACHAWAASRAGDHSHSHLASRLKLRVASGSVLGLLEDRLAVLVRLEKPEQHLQLLDRHRASSRAVRLRGGCFCMRTARQPQLGEVLAVDGHVGIIVTSRRRPILVVPAA